MVWLRQADAFCNKEAASTGKLGSTGCLPQALASGADLLSTFDWRLSQAGGSRVAREQGGKLVASTWVRAHSTPRGRAQAMASAARRSPWPGDGLLVFSPWGCVPCV